MLYKNFYSFLFSMLPSSSSIENSKSIGLLGCNLDKPQMRLLMWIHVSLSCWQT
ncbi:hypothetical protein KFK09_013050 [Dendrobium nobile]|uniref:Uncharacterized protein n=1 Tax=Dendrobium nobile TaxID=94219 RepID=A0A8T3BKL2_DENNO|nr:hypothetical protein KFK09_013050 [Dendrobium nobile]